MKKFLLQSGLILTSFILVFLWQNSELKTYSIPALGLLTAFYIFSLLKKPHAPNKPVYGTGNPMQVLTVFLLTTSSLLLILTTGGINSLLFFLLYFLSFGMAFMLIPETVFIFNIAVLFLFLPYAMQKDVVPNLVKLGSLLLLCPIAYFFGKVILAREHETKENSLRAEQIIEDASEIMQSEGKSLKERDIQKLKDIVNQGKKIERRGEVQGEMGEVGNDK